MKTTNKSRYDLPEPNPTLVKVLAPLVKLNNFYQRCFDRSFRAFELAAKPFFWAAKMLELLASRPADAIGYALAIFAVYALMHAA